MKSKALFLTTLLLSPIGWSEENLPFRADPVMVTPVTESTALGYGNGRKLVSDLNGTMYFSAVSKAPNGAPGVCVIRTGPKDSEGKSTFEQAWIENSNGAYVSTNMHFASSLAFNGSGPVYVVWSGGDQTKYNDPKKAHQIRFSKIDTGTPMKAGKINEPFTVTGFGDVYQKNVEQAKQWQEFPSAFVSQDGKLHVVWEARDASRTTTRDELVPGIAYAVRDTNGHWSVEGNVETPPYLDIKSLTGAQYRPYMLADDKGNLHVVCYGELYNRIQALYGRLTNGVFSGWTPIAPSPNDQRHVTASIDTQGRIHAVWRETQRLPQQSFIAYSMRDTNGTWSPTVRIESYRHSSTPNVTVDDNAVYVVWTSWAEGFENSDSQKNNGSPNDNDTVEGRLEFATKRFDEDHFSNPAFLTGGIGSYPRIARIRKSNPSKLAVIWALGTECLPHACVQIYFSEIATAPTLTQIPQGK